MKELYLAKSVRRALSLARGEAFRLHCDQIGIVHLIFGLVFAEREMHEHIFHDLDLVPDRVSQLVESLLGQSLLSPENLPVSPRVKHLIELAIGESHLRGHASVDIEVMLFVLANDPEGVQLFEQLGVSPEKVRSQMHYVLKESPAPLTQVHPLEVNEYSVLREKFWTPYHTVDIKKLLAECSYPVYTLVSESQSFYLCKVDFELSQDTYLDNISFEFAYPHCSAASGDLRLMQRVRVGNWGKTGLGNMCLWRTMANINATTILGDLRRLPSALVGLAGQPDSFTKADIVRWKDLLADASWEVHAGSELHFKYAYWDGGQIPVGWAYSAEEEPLVVIATLSVSRSDFVRVLESLIVLRQNNEALINKLQEEIKSVE